MPYPSGHASVDCLRSRPGVTGRSALLRRRPKPCATCPGSAPPTSSGQSPKVRARAGRWPGDALSVGTVALFQRAQGLGERPLQPGEVVGLAVMVRRELVGPPDRSVPYVLAGTLDECPDIADAFGVGH